MITFSILALVLALVTIIGLLVVAAGGTVFFVIFGDLILCICIIVWIAKRLGKKK